MSIHTKEFWQEVKAERLKSTIHLHEYLCNCSSTFYYAWKSHKHDLRDIADDFLVDSPQWNTIIKPGHYDGSVLFIPFDPNERSLLPKDRRGVRDDFIEWNLKKCA
jgi:hypothetical protein